MRIRGKIGLVTVAGSRMGREGAILFSQEGASIGGVYIDERTVTDASSMRLSTLAVKLKPLSLN